MLMIPSMTHETTPALESAERAAPRWRSVACWIVPGAMLLSAAFFYLARLDSYDPYHPDEGEWIFAGKLYTDLFFYHHDFRHPLWADQFGTWGSFNPQVGKYLIGLSVNVLGGLAPFDPPPAALRERLATEGQDPVRAAPQMMLMRRLGFFRYSFDKDLAWNRENHRLPPPAVLAAARRGVALSGLAAGVFCFLIARLLWGDVVGWVALALFLGNPVVYAASRRAMTDVPCLAFVLLGLYGVLLSLGGCGRGGWRGWGGVLLGGAGFGLALSTKLSALAPWGAAVVLLGIGILTSWVDRKAAFRALLALIVLPVVLFFASNPFLYTAPFSRFLDFPTKLQFMVHLGSFMTHYQPEAALATLCAKCSYAARFLGHEASPVGWFAFASRFIVTPMAVFFVVFFLVAAMAMIGATLRDRRRCVGVLFIPRVAFLVISMAGGVVTIAWLPLAWDRLLLPLVPFYVISMAWGGSRFIALMSAKWSRLKSAGRK